MVHGCSFFVNRVASRMLYEKTAKCRVCAFGIVVLGFFIDLLLFCPKKAQTHPMGGSRKPNIFVMLKKLTFQFRLVFLVTS